MDRNRQHTGSRRHGLSPAAGSCRIRCPFSFPLSVSFGSGKKVLNIIYYFRVFCDELPNFSETHYDELEQASEFNLYYVPFNDLGNFLKNGMNDGMLDLSIGREMLNVLSVYNDVYGG